MYYGTEHKIVNFFLEIAGAFSGSKSYDESDCSSETQTQTGTRRIATANTAIKLAAISG